MIQEAKAKKNKLTKKELSSLVRSQTMRKIEEIRLSDQHTDSSSVILAQLRRKASRGLRENFEAFDYVIHGNEKLDQLYGKELDETSEAIYTGLVLYAVAQQSRNIQTDNAFQDNVTLGTATGKLIGAMVKEKESSSNKTTSQEQDDEIWNETSDRVSRMFRKIIKSQDIDGMRNHLRGYLARLKNYNINLDYGLLARDIYLFFQDEWKYGVVKQWGKDREIAVLNERRKQNER